MDNNDLDVGNQKGSLRVLILGLNYAPELVGIAVYTTGLAEELVRRGHQVSAVSGKPYYPKWEVPYAFRGGWRLSSVEAGVSITRVAHYVPRNPTGLRRIAHHFSFAASSFWWGLQAALRLRPQIVFTVAPSLIAAPAALAIARLVKAQTWLHIQDFEVEAASATGLLASGSGVSKLGAVFERGVLTRFDRVSSISLAMCRKCIDKGVVSDRVVEFRNWADLDPNYMGKITSPYRTEWDIKTPHVALYSGNVANKQGIEIVVAAAKHLAARRDLTFVICGEGPNMVNLRASAEGLPNVVFQGLQPKARLSELLDLATVHLLPQKAGAADLVLPSKLTNMLASGRPVIATAAAGTGLAFEVEGCGIAVPPDDDLSFARAIERVLDDPGLWASCGNEARRRAEARWRRTAIIDTLEDRLKELAYSRE